MKIRIKPKFLPWLLLLLPLLVVVSYPQAVLRIGYSILTLEQGTGPVVATALFSLSNPEGFLVWEAGVGAVEPLASGRIFVDQQGTTRTAVALVNCGNSSVVVDFVLRASDGTQLATDSQIFGAGQHRPVFVDEIPVFFPHLNAEFTGSLTFSTRGSARVLGAATLRENRNLEGEAIFATLPVLDLDEPSDTTAVVFPQIGAGQGLSTQVALINRSAQTVGGRIQFFGSDGFPLQVELNGVNGSDFPYVIAGNGVFFGTVLSSQVQVGYAVVSLEQGERVPSGSAIFQFTSGQSVISEAGVGAVRPTTRARIFVDNSDTRTGVALASPGNAATAATFRLLDRNGVLLRTTTRELPSGGHLSIFADELFTLPSNFAGLLEISGEVALAPITLKLSMSTRTRGRPILTTLPIADLNEEVSLTKLVFPQIGFGTAPTVGDFSTRLILISSDPLLASSGTLFFFQSDGSSFSLPLGGVESTQFPSMVPQGGLRLFYPGVESALASILLDEASLVVNEGSTIPLNPILLDEAGNVRDDFAVSYASLTPGIAAVNPAGIVSGVSRGSSTVTVSSGGIVANAVVTVATVTAGMGGFTADGVAQDAARRVYFSSRNNHTVLLADDITAPAQLWAGTPGSAGLSNSLRLNSRFNRPSFLALNQGDGGVYVSDGQNNSIRRAGQGQNGEVQTVVGNGSAGSQDGSLSTASFNNPQGIAFDRKGNLWVVDSGNHTVRRVNLVTGAVLTLAGRAGTPGLVDAQGAQARFRSPLGIAVETEPLAVELEREARGDPPPPVSMIVADTGNDVLRRVRENGSVETITSSSVSAALSALPESPGRSRIRAGVAADPVRFRSPTGVVVDSFGNIYVSEETTGSVRTLLRTGQLVEAAQSGSFDSPRGLTISTRGRVVVAESSRSVQEIRYAGPAITAISPSRVSHRGGAVVTIQGSNLARETLIIIGGRVISNFTFVNTERLSFVAPELPSGLQTVTLQHRGGLTQSSLLVENTPLSNLASGQVVTLAGGSTFSGEGSVATGVALGVPSDVALDPTGNLFIADFEGSRIRRVDRFTSVLATLSGSGSMADQLNIPAAIALDQAGNLYIADSATHSLKRLDTSGQLRTFAGNNGRGFGGDGSVAAQARLDSPAGIVVAPNGDLYFSDTGNQRVRKIAAGNQIITTVAGTGEAGFAGDGGAPTLAQLSSPTGLAFDNSGNLCIVDQGNHVVRRIREGVIQTMAGTGQPGFSADGLPATASQLNSPADVAFDADGNFFIADSENHRIRRVEISDSSMTTFAGTGVAGFAGDGGNPRLAALNLPVGVAFDGAGNLLIADKENLRVRRIDSATTNITTVAGNGEVPTAAEPESAVRSTLRLPSELALGEDGEILIADTGHHRIVRLTDYFTSNSSQKFPQQGQVPISPGVLLGIAGSGRQGASGDGDIATLARLNFPAGIAASPDGARWISDTGNHRIRRLVSGVPDSFFQLAVTTMPGTVTTVAGGEPGFSGDGGAAADALLNRPARISAASDGRIYFIDSANHRIRRIDGPGGTILTVAGNGTAGFSGDGGMATSAALNSPQDIAVDSVGNLYIADGGNNRVRRVEAATGRITTIAGSGTRGFSGDGGIATSARLSEPRGLALDGDDRLFVADTGNHRVRLIRLSSRVITTVAGSGQSGFSGDGASALQARFNTIEDIAVDAAGNLLISDSANHRLRAVRGPLP